MEANEQLSEGNIQRQVDRQRKDALPASRPLPRAGILSAPMQVLALLLVFFNGGLALWQYSDRDEWKARAEASERSNRRLLQARCGEAVCGLQYDEHIVASRDGELLATTVWGTAPIACKQAGHVAWVRPDWDGAGFEFMCLPADGLPIRGAE